MKGNMKNRASAILVLILTASLCFGQKNPIDSLKKLLDVSAQDSARVNILLELSKANFSDAPDEAIRYATLAKDLSEEINFMNPLISAVQLLIISKEITF